MRLVKSVICTEFGGSDTLQVIDFPLKDVEDNEVEVEVHYCGLNFADIYTRLGLFPKEEKPFILGIECSGIIRNVGKDVTKFKAGDRVVCYNYNGGLHRSTITLPPSRCYLLPDTISLQTAAAAFVAFLTAHCSLFKLGALSPGHHILVHSCAGGVGTAAVQLARTVPQVTVWGTTSDPGKVTPGIVDRVLTHDTYLEEIPSRSLDLVIDNQANGSYDRNLSLLRPFGKIIVTGANYMVKNDTLCMDHPIAIPMLPQLMMDSVSVGGLHLGLAAERAASSVEATLARVWELLTGGLVTAHVDSIWPLDTSGVRSAVDLLQERRNRAKVLIKTQNALENDVK